jgi:hypothetical protein
MVGLTRQPLQPGHQAPRDVTAAVDLVVDVRLADRDITVWAPVLEVRDAELVALPGVLVIVGVLGAAVHRVSPVVLFLVRDRVRRWANVNTQSVSRLSGHYHDLLV